MVIHNDSCVPMTWPEAMSFRIHTIKQAMRGGRKGPVAGKDLGMMAFGVLTWGKHEFDAVSGPWISKEHRGKGTSAGMLPEGTYKVGSRNRDWIKTPKSSGMKARVPVAGAGRGKAKTELVQFFVPIFPDFETKRSDLGIHPDGGTEGTQGCIGIDPSDARRFLDLWTSTAEFNRPTKLIVSGPGDTVPELKLMGGTGKGQ